MSSARKSRQLTRLELQIMQVLWETGPATVQQVQSKLAGEPLAYTTVQTVLNILHRKGRVHRALQGKAYRYRALLTREKAVKQSIGDLVDRLFGGSVEDLLMSLLKDRHLDPNKLAKLNELIEKHLEAKPEGHNGRG
jgi:predicted transcriptional regulator